MPLWIALALALFAAFFGWQSWRGFRHGEVLSRHGHLGRKSDPIMFWLLFLIYTAGAACLVIILALFLIIGGLKR